MEYLTFGKYTWYVWSSAALTFVVLGANIFLARRRLQLHIEKARRRLATEEV
ncbi:heme exporter protein CcmD [Wenzhouxiangella sp. XN24]|uniref:heme exporter protein CcmD n=1 Tax=Wenzhouxiangella sp. XN24 TaxID=2713569 RepID=UPI0013E9E6E7|nr:heme exporter protein CcmD [Wenzhouxiangella sp. XN24]